MQDNVSFNLTLALHSGKRCNLGCTPPDAGKSRDLFDLGLPSKQNSYGDRMFQKLMLLFMLKENVLLCQISLSKAPIISRFDGNSLTLSFELKFYLPALLNQDPLASTKSSLVIGNHPRIVPQLVARQPTSCVMCCLRSSRCSIYVWNWIIGVSHTD